MATASPYPSIDIPSVDIWTLLFEGKREFSDDKVIFVEPHTTRKYTFNEIKHIAAAFGNALRSQWNWQKSDCIAIFSPNSIEYPIATFGALWAGAVVSPANPSYTATELAFQLKDSQAKALVTQVSHLEVTLAAARLARIPLDRVLIMGNGSTDKVQHIAQFIALVKDHALTERVCFAPSDVAYLVYSSGTTGLPKGVMLSHQNIVVNILQNHHVQTDLRLDGGEDGQGDVVIAVLPFYHIYGMLYETAYMIHLGMKVVVLPAFQPDTFCQAVQDHRCTFAYLVPPIVLFLEKSPIVDSYDLSSLKSGMSAAAPLTMDLVEGLWARLGIRVKQGYGLSETAPAIAVMEIDHWHTKVGSVGRVLPNQTVKIMSEDDQILGAGLDGEILVRGPNVFPGYLNNTSATNHCMTQDGFFKTGDIGHFDADGFLFITDRKKELIKYKGFQVAPAELEGLLVGHQHVADACVLGIYEESQATELPRAFLVKTEAARAIEDDILEKEIQAWLHAKVASHKKLRGGICFVDTIPKSAAGKILRRVLREHVSKAAVHIQPPRSKL